jgi:hypothetical protein
MGLRSDLRVVNKARDFAFKAARTGGSFETNCTAEQIIEWLKASDLQITEESTTSLSGHPRDRNGVGPEILTARVMPGTKLRSLVVIEVQLTAMPGGKIPPRTFLPIHGLLVKLGKADPQWQPS